MTRLVTILCLLPLTLMAQTGGKNAFPFLDLPDNARAAALGRIFITAYDDDINTGIQNPAALNSNMDNSMGFNQALLAGGIRSEEHTSELQSRPHLVCRLLLEK